MYNNRQYQYLHIASAAAATTVCFLGRGQIGGICINTATAVAAVTVKDSTNGTTGTTVAIFAATTPAGTYLAGGGISQGLTIVTAGASDLTILYTQG